MSDTPYHDRTDHDGMIVETLTLIEALEAESKCECFVQAKENGPEISVTSFELHLQPRAKRLTSPHLTFKLP